ncbi:PIN domain-containing protein [Infirmifilum sp. NZ]|uniref:PIN domain-containing protein n=1 Tax=Infirmifilum sp. NZ TaxID=2926850 RepID=UPI0027988030|nr:PIN domain-containing protein [Infirmifilum sp. NZ]UNQ73567.1 hypothetical protein MOV14_00790 [Infirmifilum sp. NZ]
MTRVMIDTELWSLAKKKPSAEKFKSRGEFEKFLMMHEKAKHFFREEVPDFKVYMSLHQLAEIYHVLAYRGIRIPPNEALELVHALLEDPNVVKVPTTAEHLREAVEMSTKTGIHLWDFLCFLPVRPFVEKVYSADKHFLTIGKLYGVEVINPIAEWTEG